MRRRAWLMAVLAAAAGCSGTKRKGKSSARTRAKGPQTMGGLVVDAYIADLGGGSAEKRIRAARELGSLGADAKKAVPALEKMAADKRRSVADAAKAALAAIRK